MSEKIETFLAKIVTALNRIADTQEKQLEILRGQAAAAAEARQQSAGAADVLKTVMSMIKPVKGA